MRCGEQGRGYNYALFRQMGIESERSRRDQYWL
jgi:hypothetical protein